MKEFNLTEYLKDPSKKVVTRDGQEVRIICTDHKCTQPIIALVTTNKIEYVHLFCKNGRWSNQGKSNLDLFFVTTKKEGWINVYRSKNDTRTLGCLFSSEEEAIKHKLNEHIRYIKTIKIEWEE